MALTDLKIKALKPTDKVYKVFDGAGLYIEVPPRGKKRWRLRYKLGGKENRVSLGLYPDVSLKEAREKAGEFKAGLDGRTKRSEVRTFKEVAQEWIEMHRGVWTDKYHEETSRKLEIDIYGKIGDADIRSISPRMVLDALRQIEARGVFETARKVMSLCSLIFRFGVASSYVDSDPCRDLKGALAPRRQGHFAAITDAAGASALMRAVDAYRGSAIVRLSLLFTAYTFVRQGEMRFSTWEEFDFDKALWTIPARRMKMRREHLVPLSRQVVAVLREVKEVCPDGAYVFMSIRSKGKPLSENTVRMAIRSMGFDNDTMTAHGFRAMASSLLNEQGWRPDVIERQLAHVEGNSVRAAYNRTDYLVERTRMMQAWADFLDSLRGLL